MKLIALTVLALACSTPAWANCEQDLAATGEYGSILEQSQNSLQRELAVLRVKYAAAQKALADAQKKDADKTPTTEAK